MDYMIEYIKSELCIGCGLCVLLCPMDVIRLDKREQKAIIKYRNDCMSCFNCEMNCPEKGTIYVSPERSQFVRLPW